MGYFDHIPNIRYEGASSQNPFAFHYYDADALIAGKPHYKGYEYTTLYDWDPKRLCQEISSAPGTPTHVFQELGKYGYSELAAAENMHVLLNKEGKGKGMV